MRGPGQIQLNVIKEPMGRAEGRTEKLVSTTSKESSGIPPRVCALERTSSVDSRQESSMERVVKGSGAMLGLEVRQRLANWCEGNTERAHEF